VFRLLNAKQDADEAAIIACAGQRGAITLATNMAGRGAHIPLQPGVAELGGLHVIGCEPHDSARVDRQLVGRCARQGDPGSYEVILSLQDSLLKKYFPGTLTLLARAVARLGIPMPIGIMMRIAQRFAEHYHERLRRNLLRKDEKLKETLAFTGPVE